jgi:uncharacterized protein YegL
MTKPNSTEIVFVLDRSGSMQDIAKDMEGGFNEFIKQQKTVPGECSVTLVQFDTEYEVVYAGTALDKVPALKLEPRGMTALLDAVGTAVQTTGLRLSLLPENQRPSKVIVVVLTDGQENSSKEYTSARVADMIKLQREKYQWDFVFLGADLNAIEVAAKLNINNAAVYHANAVGSVQAFNSVSNAVGASRITGDALDYSQSTYDSTIVKGGS